MQFIANETAAILQNIAKQRSAEGKTVTLIDIVNAIRLSYLTYFPGITQYSTESWTFMPLGYMPLVRVYYVIGDAPGSASIKWYARFHPYEGYKGGKYLNDSFYSERYAGESTIENWRGKDSNIHPYLRMTQKGDAKIIVECSLCNNSSFTCFSDRRPTRNISKRELFGFLLFSPYSKTQLIYFTAVSIFTPQGGFSETAPW